MSARRFIARLFCIFPFSVLAYAAAADEIRLDFGTEETVPLTLHGGVHRDVPGPIPPDYPDFQANNTAVRLDGNGARLILDDPGAQSPYDFSNGDAITLEAWVQIDELRTGENAYVIGKGRTGSPGFAADNQNWALRLRESKGKAAVNFLFATVRNKDAARADEHWHRWTTTDGFSPGKGWHHVAVTYKYGDPSSIRGWIDGKPRAGTWDMGGPTNEPPVVDDDAVWIGSSQGGKANSFRGSLDSITVHRKIVDDSVLKGRYRFTGTEIVIKPAAEVMPKLEQLPLGTGLFTFHEGMPSHSRWLNEGENLPAETLRWQPEVFLMDRLPQRFDSWGIRDNWKAPVLTRMSADLQMTPGKHRFLMRVRGLSRLWVNGTVIARAKPMTGSPSGEEPMTPVPEPPLPGLRIAEHRQQEVIGEAVIGDDGICRVVLETLVGSKDFRTDPGETCVAVLSDDGTSFELLPGRKVSLEDEPVEAALRRQQVELNAFDDSNRRAAAASQDAFWVDRHNFARKWLDANPLPATLASAKTDQHPIDAFIAMKIDKALTESAATTPEQATQFHSSVLPILRDECFRCHGEKENGGLRLNSREAVTASGDSGEFAVVPGDVAKSEMIRRIRSSDPDERMPPGAAALRPEQLASLESWIQSGAEWPAPPISATEVALAPVIGDADFVRRVFLDAIGLPPSEAEVRDFLSDSAVHKRVQLVDRLLANESWADHWMSYWQDVLAENPTMLNPSLNTTGPFRWFLYDSLRDNKPIDRMVTELILLRGSPHEGGSAGFGIAANNDAPFAAKGQIIANAFLGIELQCARCHDSPYHSTKQSDLYSLAAMFEKKTVTVPKTSRVPAAFFENKLRESLIKVTLKHDEPIEPKWPFEAVCGNSDDATLQPLLQQPENSRERLGALVTSPQNNRFARVIVNRIWRRFMGAGIVEPVHDWEGRSASHPELLDWLAREFIAHNYDAKHVVRLILTSQAYQREAKGNNLTATDELRFFNAPDRRRLSAEQIVDTLHAASGHEMNVEELTFDPDARRPSSNRLTLGRPTRAWMFASLANERDRPTLSLPRAQAVADILDAFGWSGSRQNPRTDREISPNVLQPGVLANSTASVLLTRASQGSALADLAVNATSPDELVDSIFLRYLSRYPSESERSSLVPELAEGFDDRIVPENEMQTSETPERLPKVTWSNHLRSEANLVALEIERRARIGVSADPRLRAGWREVFEDTVWSVINIREFVWVP